MGLPLQRLHVYMNYELITTYSQRNTCVGLLPKVELPPCTIGFVHVQCTCATNNDVLEWLTKMLLASARVCVHGKYDFESS